MAVLGRRKPWGVFLAALLFGVLEAGGMSMRLFAKIPSDLMGGSGIGDFIGLGSRPDSTTAGPEIGEKR